MPLYFKFQSFNVFGAGLQSLAACVAYAYTPTGAGTIGPVTQALLVGTALDFGSVTAAANESDDWGGNVTSAATVSVELGSVTN